MVLLVEIQRVNAPDSHRVAAVKLVRQMGRSICEIFNLGSGRFGAVVECPTDEESDRVLFGLKSILKTILMDTMI
jgi:hypothetical protein